MCNRIIIIIAASLLLALAGCSGSESDTLSQEDAAEAFGSTSLALASIQEVVIDASTDGTTSISANASCMAGGSASINGTATAAGSFSLMVQFSNCTEAGITMSGSMSYDATFAEETISISMSGTLRFSGNVEGSCDLDISTSVGENGVTFEGSMCGQNVDAFAG